ncbi:hypothetical protein BTVI_51115 [Pitangus sulphuratus]|nr:hypothetical protein BTVI_51115 [Pitangus sulphuratus]
MRVCPATRREAIDLAALIDRLHARTSQHCKRKRSFYRRVSAWRYLGELGVMPGVSTEEGLAPPRAAWGVIQHQTARVLSVPDDRGKEESQHLKLGRPMGRTIENHCSKGLVKSWANTLSNQASAQWEKDQVMPSGLVLAWTEIRLHDPIKEEEFWTGRDGKVAARRFTVPSIVSEALTSALWEKKAPNQLLFKPASRGICERVFYNF